MNQVPVLRILRRALRHRWPVVLAVLAPAVVLGVGAVENRPDSEVAVAVVGVGPETPETTNADAVRFALGRFAVAVTSEAVLGDVADTTGAEVSTLESAVDVSVSQDAGSLTVRATMPTRDEALQVAQAVADAAVGLSEDDASASASVLSAARIEAPGPLASPRVLELVIVLGALLLALAVAYALELTRPRIRTGGDAAEAVGGPLIGNLPVLTGSWPRSVVAPDDEILASARSLRSGWTATAGAVPPGPVLVVGTEPGAGATTVTFLLAKTLAGRGETTLVLDLDLDGAGLTTRMGQPRRQGLGDVLAGRAELAAAIHHEGEVAVLPAQPLRGSDDLVDRRLPGLLRHASGRWNVVLCDTTPLDAGESSEVVAPHTASAVVVVPLGSSRATAERTAVRLARLGLPVRGVVLNRAGRDRAEAPGLTGRGGLRG
ncbi:hypothetical protein GCM10027062_35780 [Nocardioides hungaricus]